MTKTAGASGSFIKGLYWFPFDPFYPAEDRLGNAVAPVNDKGLVA
jgi:hypothetical protein